jgi:hypothetical protein
MNIVELYIYTEGIGPSLTLQDKNLTNIYFELPEKELNIINYASKMSLILSNLKNDLWIFIATGKIAQFILVAAIESIACC